MTWIKFVLWLTAVYAVYYTLLISWDLLRISTASPLPEDEMLTFTEDIAPVKPGFETLPEAQWAPVVASGGVSLRQLFNLCRDEVVDYRKAVSY